jgi:hypothetical protein
VKGKKGETHISGFQGSQLREFECPNININKLSKMQKRKELTFGDFGVWGFKCQTTTYNNSQILKGERVWDQHFGILGFRVSGFGKTRELRINVTS